MGKSRGGRVMGKRLEEALRQYKHNRGKGGFVFAYDKHTVDSIFADLRKIVEWMESKAGEAYDKQDYKGYAAYLNCEQKARKLLEGE